MRIGYTETCMLFGELITFWENDYGERIILVEEKSGNLAGRKWHALPKKFEIKLGEGELSEGIPVIGRMVAFRIDIDFYKNKQISGFEINALLSLDIESWLKIILNSIQLTSQAKSTNLPIMQYLKYMNNSNLINNTVEIQGVKYEMAFIETNILLKFEGLLYSYGLRGGRRSGNYESDNGSVGDTLINIDKDSERYLTLSNISLIFDKFYRHVRGLGHNFEYSYGQSVTYRVSEVGDIIHTRHVDMVAGKADRSGDRSHIKETIVFRLGDQLTDEMVDFLKEPVKGHYEPHLLF